MTEPITDAELDEWERVHRDMQSALDSLGSMDATYFEKTALLDDVVEEAFPRLLAEHRKMRAHIVIRSARMD